ncbi:MAG: hypothetical protein ACYCYG_07935 [Bellilinea sp.]
MTESSLRGSQMTGGCRPSTRSVVVIAREPRKGRPWRAEVMRMEGRRWMEAKIATPLRGSQ